jgi:hypothetical protein
MLWKLIIKVLKVFLFFCLLWGSLVVRFAVLVPRHVNGEKRHWPVMNATHGIMHHVQGSTHKNTRDLQTHLRVSNARVAVVRIES